MTREEAIDVLKAYLMFDKSSQQVAKALDMAIEALKDRPKGEWIDKDGELVCSVCGNSVSFSRTPKGWTLGRFCQTCGTRMNKGGDTE